MNRIRANGLEFAYLEAGAGPLIVCLHGFPDNAWSWEYQIPRFAEAGFRVVAPEVMERVEKELARAATDRG